MAEYYFDIETYSPGEKPNPDNDKIITIQFQRIDLRTGKSIGELRILREWDSSEKYIVTEFYNTFFRDGLHIFDFVAVGFGLNFEWEFLISKFEKYFGKKISSRELHYSRPHVDIKPIIVLLNNGSFKEAKLDKFTKKQSDGKVIKQMYENREWENIDNYIKKEAEAFLEFLQNFENYFVKKGKKGSRLTAYRITNPGLQEGVKLIKQIGGKNESTN